MNQEYPWEHLAASRRNRRLQKTHPLPVDLPTHFGDARPCPKCGANIEKLTWFYFRSPKETWPMLCGVAGWMAVCDRCHIQVNFFSEVMS